MEKWLKRSKIISYQQVTTLTNGMVLTRMDHGWQRAYICINCAPVTVSKRGNFSFWIKIEKMYLISFLRIVDHTYRPQITQISQTSIHKFWLKSVKSAKSVAKMPKIRLIGYYEFNYKILSVNTNKPQAWELNFRILKLEI